jgi:hypothetical protein
VNGWLAVVQVTCVITLFVMAMLRERYWKNRMAQRDQHWQDDIATLETQHREERQRWNEHLINVRKQRDEWRDQAIQYKDALDGKIVVSDKQTVDNRYITGKTAAGDFMGDPLGEAVVRSAMHKSAHRIASSIIDKAKISLEPQPETDSTVVHVKVYLKDLL